MKKYTSVVALAVVFAIYAFSPTSYADAAIISDSRIEAQRDVIKETQHTLIEERLKLVQMLLINALGQRIDQLKEQLDE